MLHVPYYSKIIEGEPDDRQCIWNMTGKVAGIVAALVQGAVDPQTCVRPRHPYIKSTKKTITRPHYNKKCISIEVRFLHI